jgi:hypothetical protein
MKLNVSDMKKTYQIPALYQDNVLDECQLLVGTTIPVDPGDEGSQSQAESKRGMFEDSDNAMNSYGHNYSVWGEE